NQNQKQNQANSLSNQNQNSANSAMELMVRMLRKETKIDLSGHLPKKAPAEQMREEMERGVFDIEAVKAANANLIATINESLQIADDGKAKRAAAEEELQKMETELRDTLASAKARQDGVGDTAATSVPDA
ncbi:MAG: hypothetical protein GY826_11555, partial [Fuerstiella sp.]|nr:hypothetical protein [Fuerstiella sp.]